MIKIEIRIMDTPLPGGGGYGKIEAMPENVGPVSQQECHLRDMIMDTLMKLAEAISTMEGVERTYIAKVPIKKKGKDVHTRDNRNNPGTMR